MTLAFALAAAALFGAGAVLALAGDLVRVVAGMVLISQSAILTVIAAGLARGPAPILPAEGEPSDPLVQAMALTAIVIGLGVTALLLAIVLRVRVAFGTLDVDELSGVEAEHTAERGRRAGPPVEERRAGEEGR